MADKIYMFDDIFFLEEFIYSLYQSSFGIKIQDASYEENGKFTLNLTTDLTAEEEEEWNDLKNRYVLLKSAINHAKFIKTENVDNIMVFFMALLFTDKRTIAERKTAYAELEGLRLACKYGDSELIMAELLQLKTTSSYFSDIDIDKILAGMQRFTMERPVWSYLNPLQGCTLYNPKTFTVEDLLDLTDLNGEIDYFMCIHSIDNNGVLKINDRTVTHDTLISPGDIFEFIPTSSGTVDICSLWPVNNFIFSEQDRTLQAVVS